MYNHTNINPEIRKQIIADAIWAILTDPEYDVRGAHTFMDALQDIARDYKVWAGGKMLNRLKKIDPITYAYLLPWMQESVLPKEANSV